MESVSRETSPELAAFLEVQRDWNRRIQLQGPGHRDDLEPRIKAEVASLMARFPDHRAVRWADLGSGGGLPAIPLLLARARPDDVLTLVESDGRKAAFLRHAIRTIGRRAEVVARRIEDIPPLGVEIVTARALAPLDRLVGYAARHLALGGRLLALKGARAEEEVETARRVWPACYVIHSDTGQARVVEVSGIEAQPRGGPDGA